MAQIHMVIVGGNITFDLPKGLTNIIINKYITLSWSVTMILSFTFKIWQENERDITLCLTREGNITFI